jgi:hypothetical protein
MPEVPGAPACCAEGVVMKIPNSNEITSYMHCANCMGDKPSDISPADWARTQAGFTPIGLQVWCNRCDCNICHIDFEGTKVATLLKSWMIKAQFCRPGSAYRVRNRL